MEAPAQDSKTISPLAESCRTTLSILKNLLQRYNSLRSTTHQAGYESTNPHQKNIARNVSGEKCDFANAASGDVHTHRIEPRCNDQWKFAESDTVAIVEGRYRNTSWISEA